MKKQIKKLENVFWLGGSPCAGKSSIAAILAERFNLDLHRVDENFDVHVVNLDANLHPNLSDWRTSDWNQRWLPPVDEILRNVIGCYREHFDFILEDVLSMSGQKPLLVEGTALLPKCVAPLLSASNRAIWLIPTFDFQMKHYSAREWVQPIIEQCDKPETAFDNWMKRDADFALWIEQEVKTLDLKLIKVDGNRTIEETAADVQAHFCFDELNYKYGE